MYTEGRSASTATGWSLQSNLSCHFFRRSKKLASVFLRTATHYKAPLLLAPREGRVKTMIRIVTQLKMVVDELELLDLQK